MIYQITFFINNIFLDVTKMLNCSHKTHKYEKNIKISRTDGQCESRSTSTKQKNVLGELGHNKTLRYISDRHQPERRTDRQTDWRPTQNSC